MATFPVRSLEDCTKIMTAQGVGSPFELTEAVVRGNKLRVYKNLWPSLRFMWQTTKVS